VSLANFGDLKSAVALYLNRSDLTSYIPDFVHLAESRIAYGSDAPYPSPPVRVPVMQNRATGTISGAIAYPTGFLELILLRISSGATNWKADYADSGTFTDYSNSPDTPKVYTFLNNQIELAGTGSGSYTLDYYKKLDAFSADADTNTLLTTSPAVYLFGTLLESAPFLMDQQTAALLPGWFGMYKSAVSSLNRTTLKPAGGTLQVNAR
jgi:hypothetical protein